MRLTDLGVKQRAFLEFFLDGWTFIDLSNNLRGSFEGSVIFSYSTKHGVLVLLSQLQKRFGSESLHFREKSDQNIRSLHNVKNGECCDIQ